MPRLTSLLPSLAVLALGVLLATRPLYSSLKRAALSLGVPAEIVTVLVVSVLTGGAVLMLRSLRRGSR